MKNLLPVSLFLLGFQTSFSQDNSFIHPTPGQFFLSACQFTTPSDSTEVYPGFGFNFTKGLQPRLDWGATINFAMADSVMKLKEGFNSKQLLIEADLSLRYRVFPPSRFLQPYVLSGLGVSAFKTYLGEYLLIGGGVQAKILENVSILSLDKISVVVNVQRKLRLTNTLSNHNIYSIGLAGNIGKLIKERPIPELPLNPVPIVISDRDNDGVVDSMDLCPDVPGITAYKACPDTAHTGIA